MKSLISVEKDFDRSYFDHSTLV